MTDITFTYEQALHRVGFEAQSMLVDVSHRTMIDAEDVQDYLLDTIRIIGEALDG